MAILFPSYFGAPPGTGKTTTLVAAIFQLILPGTAKVLVTAPSNAAADLIAERLAKLGVQPKRMLRLNAALRDVKTMPGILQAYSTWSELDHAFRLPQEEELKSFEVVVCTCTCAGYVASSTTGPGWFTHVIVDEAAQALEPEVAIPLTVAEPGALLVLAGDFKQLGAYCPFARCC